MPTTRLETAPYRSMDADYKGRQTTEIATPDEIADHLKSVLDHSDWFFKHGLSLTVTPKPNGFSVKITE